MTHFPVKRLLGHGALCAASALLLSGCIDDSYDLGNVDLTMGLGSDGLSVNIGNTEKIYLNDILSVDESVKLDNANLYYLVEDGTTNFSVEVEDVDVAIENAYINTSQRVLSFDDMVEQIGASSDVSSLYITAGHSAEGEATGSSVFDVHVDNIGPEIVRINSISLEETPVRIYMRVENSANMRFDIDYLKDFSITFPNFLNIKNPADGWRQEGQKLVHDGSFTIPADGMICMFYCDRTEFDEDGVPVDGTITLSDENASISMEGAVGFHNNTAFTMTPDDYTDVRVQVVVGDGTGNLGINDVTGFFDPEINPDVESIDIATSLPDFLKEDGVRISVANPTLKFTADLTQIPVGVNLSGELTAVKAGANGFSKTVELPALPVENAQQNTLYYYQGTAPYDPETDAATAQTAGAQVTNLGTLIEQLPDQINVNLADGHLAVQNKEYTVQLGRAYTANAAYKVYAPFEFNEGLVIVYRDSTESVSEDLEDYAAEGARVTATVENTIPLNLVLNVEARDINNLPIDGITFSSAAINAGDDNSEEPVTTEITVDGDLENPEDLKKIDTFFFRIEAASGEGSESHSLVSTQYVRLTDVRIRLKGAVIADLN